MFKQLLNIIEATRPILHVIFNQILPLTKPSDLAIFTLILHFIAGRRHDLFKIEAFDAGRVKTFGAVAFF